MHVCLWSVGIDWNVLLPWTLLVFLTTESFFFKCSLGPETQKKMWGGGFGGEPRPLGVARGRKTIHFL